MDNNGFVSIAMLTYNRANDLEKSINSLLKQTHSNFELIINDDNSPDHTQAVVEKFMKQDSRVKYFKNATNRRYAGNSNEALLRANSDYVAIVHDGDEYEPEMIEMWYNILCKYPQSSLAFSGSYSMDHAGNIANQNSHNYPELIEGKSLLHEMLLRFESPIWGIVMIRKSKVEELGMFNENYPRLTDVDMWLRLAATSDVAYVNKPLYKVAPREKGHENATGNWKIFNEQLCMRRHHIEQTFSEKGPLQIKYHKKYNKDVINYYIRNQMVCLKELKIREFFSGLVFVKTIYQQLFK